MHASTRCLVCASGLLLAGSGGCDLTRGLKGPLQEAVSVIDKGIRTIDENSAQWQTALREVSQGLPDELNATIRNEASTLAQRSIAAEVVRVDSVLA